MRCFLCVCATVALNLGVKKVVKQPQGEGFFTEDPQAMNDLTNTATTESCHPQCTWKCDSSACEESCEPLCAPPKCETSCAAFDATLCTQTCDEPTCAVVCPQQHCEMGECPTCKTICSPATNCKTTCPSGECFSKCADPECEWKCKPRDDCPSPTCRMQCEEPKDCFQQAGGKAVPKIPDTVVVASKLASLNIGDLTGGGNGTNGTSLIRTKSRVRRTKTFALADLFKFLRSTTGARR